MADLRDQLQSSLDSSYTIEHEIGGGGMSRVFVATDQTLGRQVVVKVLPPEMVAGVSIERFKREIQLAARLQHPHIVPLLSAGEIDGLPYFTMPYVVGETLRVRLARHGELPVAEAMRVLREIASALDYAHEHGVVHRDIKPDNVLLSRGSAMVTDFGVAKALSSSSNAEHGGVTSLGIALGTPAYMAPEQATADPSVDHRADIYAFGVLAYEMLTGQAPFSGRTPQGMLAAHVTETPEPIQKRRASLPPALSALVMQCLEKRPADRPQTAGEIVHALDAMTTPSGGTAPTSAQLPPVPRPARPSMLMAAVRQSRAVVFAAATVALVVLLVAGYVYQKMRQASVLAVQRSIVVMPFANAGADTAMQFFADGMTDELTTAVARIPEIQVASRNATDAAVKAAVGDLKAVGHRLGVFAALEGQVRRSGSHMRLTATLTNIANSRILWTEVYDREVKDAFHVQDDVARAIARSLRISLKPAQKEVSRGTTSVEAHDLYLRGRYLQEQYSEVSLQKSLELFRQALTKDSNYVLAWSGIADSWAMLADDFVAPNDAYPKMREAIARAEAIDSTLPELKYTKSMVLWLVEYDPNRGAALMEDALRSPNVMSTDAPYYYAAYLWQAGMRDSAAAVMRFTVERDPVSPDVLGRAFSHFFSIGDLSAARGYCARLAELNAAYALGPSGGESGGACGAQLLLVDGRAAEALEYYQRGVNDPDPRASLRAKRGVVAALSALGRKQEARQVITRLEADANIGHRYIREDVIARMWALAGDNDRALAWYERAVRSKSGGIPLLYRSIATLPIVHDPRLQALLKRAGVPNPPPYL
jgi:serine/threonine-protein kinase